MKKIGNPLAVAGIIFLSSVSFAKEVHFSASVDRTEISKNDALVLTLTLSSDGNLSADQEPRLPQLEGWQLMDRWTQSESSSVFENGQFKFLRKFVYRYTLAPQKTGTLNIDQAHIRVDGKDFSTSPIKVKVVAGNTSIPKQAQKEDEDQNNNGPFGNDDDDEDLFTQLLKRRGFGVPQAPRSHQAPGQNGGVAPVPDLDNEEVNDNDVFFLGVEVSKKKVYVGEEVIAKWYLYTRGSIQAFDALKYPELKGFWKEDLEMATKLNFEQVNVNGKIYNRAPLVSYALFPIGTGNKVIDPYQAKATVIKMDSPMAMFGLGRPVNLTKASKEIPIEVMPLPTEGKPYTFTGGVGHFNVTGSLSSTTVKANQPVSLKIKFSGLGNAKAIELPPLTLPKNLELYDTKNEVKFQKTGEGTKEFELLIIPRAEGEVTIPPISVSYFDPKTAKYITTQTPTFALKVLPGDPTSANNVAPLPTALPMPTAGAAQDDIKYLKTMPTWSLPPQEEKLLWIVAFLTVYLSFGLQIYKTITGRTGDSAAETKKRVKKKLLAARAKLKAQDWRGVGVECQNAVLQTLSEVTKGKLSQPAEELLALLPTGSENVQNQTRKFLSQCEVISFAPQEMASQMNNEVQKLISGAEGVIGELLTGGSSGKSKK